MYEAVKASTAAGGLSPGASVAARYRPAGRFAWHFLQMALAMMLGMVPLFIVLRLLGVSNLSSTRPELFAVVMSLSMVVAMAAWMRYRMGHGWARTTEMSVAMVLPVAVVVPLCLAGVLPHTFALGPTHVVMPLAMLADMGFRWRDYTGHRPSVNKAAGEHVSRVPQLGQEV